MPGIHPTAIVHPSAQISERAQVGPYCVVAEEVRIGSNTRIRAHVVIEPFTHIGDDCDIWPGAILGGSPQDRKFKGEKGYLIIGDSNIVRECVTIHRAAGAGQETRIGNNNLIMAYSHIGHNCVIGDWVTMANMVGISGHTIVEDRVNIGGFVGIHQFVRVGRLAMLGGYSKVVQDVPPFMMADGRPSKVLDLNVIGLRRAGVAAETRASLKHAYKLLYRSNLNQSQALEMISDDIAPSPERDYLLEFLRNIRFGYSGRQGEPPRV